MAPLPVPNFRTRTMVWLRSWCQVDEFVVLEPFICWSLCFFHFPHVCCIWSIIVIIIVIVMWSCDHVIMWSCDHVIMWSSSSSSSSSLLCDYVDLAVETPFDFRFLLWFLWESWGWPYQSDKPESGDFNFNHWRLRSSDHDLLEGMHPKTLFTHVHFPYLATHA
jgi:hypothetical protein